MIYNHLRNIAFEYIYQSNDNINMIMIEFINSYHGTEYLKDIYNMNCSYYWDNELEINEYDLFNLIDSNLVDFIFSMFFKSIFNVDSVEILI